MSERRKSRPEQAGVRPDRSSGSRTCRGQGGFRPRRVTTWLLKLRLNRDGNEEEEGRVLMQGQNMARERDCRF